MNALKNIERVQINAEMMLLLLTSYEYKGKSFYYDDLFNRDFSAFSKKAEENDIIALASYLSLDMTDTRIKLFAKKKMVPRTKDEHLLSNIKLAIHQLRKGFADFELLVNEVDNLIKLLSKQTDPIQFNVSVDHKNGMLGSKAKLGKREDLEALMALYNKYERGQKHELTQLITSFYVDFLNMDIIDNRAELIAAILLFAMTSKRFGVFKYVSFFTYLTNIKDAWHNSFVSASYYWEQGYPQIDMLNRLLVSLILDSYKEIDQFAHEYEFEKKLNKSDNLENSILKLPEIFSKSDLRKRHPNVSDATIDRTLKRLKDENKIRPLGTGRSAKWQRIIPGRKKLSAEQLTLFD